jgi:hypothetical protein
MKYWQPIHQKAIEQFYYAYTSSTSAQTRQLIFNTILYSPFVILSETALKSFHNPKYINEDTEQECLLFIWQLLPKLNPNKYPDGLKGTFNFIWVSVRRNIINIIRQAEQIPMTESLDVVHDNNDRFESYNSPFNDALIDNDNTPDKHFRQDEIRNNIITELNRRIHKQKVVNKSSTIFLIHFKDYLLANQFDERGFKDYAMNKMNIDLKTYRAIASSVRISTLLLNKDLIK